MPSPFPGMDPYLEHPRVWPGVHANLILEFQARLSDALDPRYLVDIEQRLYITPANSADADDRLGLVPDLSIRRGSPVKLAARSRGTAVLEPVTVLERATWTARENYLVITDPDSDEGPVAVLELLSPGNKTRGIGRRKYLRKRRRTLDSDTHLIEIDLLRAGEPTMPCPKRRTSDYRVDISDARQRPKGQLWQIDLKDALPTIPIPLLKNEFVDLPLQDSLVAIYSRAKYASKIKYDAAAVPPLTEEQQAWVKRLKARR